MPPRKSRLVNRLIVISLFAWATVRLTLEFLLLWGWPLDVKSLFETRADYSLRMVETYTRGDWQNERRGDIAVHSFRNLPAPERAKALAIGLRNQGIIGLQTRPFASQLLLECGQDAVTALRREIDMLGSQEQVAKMELIATLYLLTGDASLIETWRSLYLSYYHQHSSPPPNHVLTFEWYIYGRLPSNACEDLEPIFRSNRHGDLVLPNLRFLDWLNKNKHAMKTGPLRNE